MRSDDCNAAALTHAGAFAVFFTSGLIDRLSRCLRLFICTSKLLRESFGRPPIRDERLWSADPRCFLDHAPSNEVQYFYDSLGRAIEFIWFHEVAHRIRAHAQLTVPGSGVGSFEEIYWMSSADEAVNAPVRHQCEIDADIIAARFCIENDARAAAARDPQQQHDFWLSEMGIRLVGLVNTFVLLDSSIKDRRIVYDRFYPPLLHRAILASTSITAAYAASGGMDIDFAKGVEAQIWIDIAAVTDWLEMPSGDWVDPQKSIINLEDLNRRLADFRKFQDALDADLDQRLSNAGPKSIAQPLS